MKKKYLNTFLILCLTMLITACGFHLQGEAKLAPQLNRMYLQTSDPYGHLARSLQQYLKLSHVQLVASPAQASTILSILHDDTSQELLSVSGTQQTRQYTLKVTVVFEITTPKGQTILGPQTLTESRTITIQANQILGSTNEATLFYQQMRRTLAYAIMNRIASREVTRAVENAFKL
jgi:LPS-assembly lipoprotein